MSEALNLFFDHFRSFFRIYLLILFPGFICSILSLLMKEGVFLSILWVIVGPLMGFVGGVYLLSFTAYLSRSGDGALSLWWACLAQIVSDGKKIFVAPLLPLLLFLSSFVATLFFLIAFTSRWLSGTWSSPHIHLLFDMSSIPPVLIGGWLLVSGAIAMISYHAMYFSIFYRLQPSSWVMRVGIWQTMFFGYRLTLRYIWVLLLLSFLLAIIWFTLKWMLSLLDFLFRWGDISTSLSTIWFAGDISSLLGRDALLAKISHMTQEDVLQIIRSITQQSISSRMISVVKDMIDLSMLSITFLAYAELTKKYIQKLTTSS